ncbi:MAG TPA: AAA family ATPase, partial [Thermomicrobiaceae bacterium]|nr:AAA family ATPase [Thermomicrobiaceae bacterium]
MRPLLVGRERERSLLRAQLETALHGRGGLVLVSGDAGIGKTTLLEDLATDAEKTGCFVLWGHAYDLTVTPPYGPWVELAASYVPTDNLPSFPAFLHGGAALAAVGSQEALFAQTWDFFATVATTRPVVLLVEDLHWADQESLALLRFVARHAGHDRVLLAATFRSDGLSRHHPLYPVIPLLVREAGAARLELRPLGAAAMRRLIVARYRLPDADAVRLEAYLAEHAEGNPFYASELLRTLEDDRLLVEQSDRWELGDLDRARVPPLLMQVIEGRLARLSPETRGLLELAAIIGQEVPLELWQTVSGADDEALADVVEEGLEAHLLTEAPDGTIRFSHALVREALYQGVVLVRRRGLHRAAGEALAETQSPDPDAVAHHFEQAGDSRASEWLIKAGERAEASYAWISAAARFEAALALRAEQGAAASERVVLLLTIAQLRQYFDPRQALVLLDEARRLADDAGERALVCSCLHISGILGTFLGEIRSATAALERALDGYRALSEPEQARLRSLVGLDADAAAGVLTLALAAVGRLADAVTLGEGLVAARAAVAGRERQRSAVYAQGLFGLGVARAFQGQPAVARRCFDQARTQASEDYQGLVETCGAELEWVQLPYFPDELQERRRLADEGEAAGQRAAGATLGTVPVQVVSLPLLHLEGAWQEVREAALGLQQSLWHYRLIGSIWLGPLARAQGEPELAWRVIGDVL